MCSREKRGHLGSARAQHPGFLTAGPSAFTGSVPKAVTGWRCQKSSALVLLANRWNKFPNSKLASAGQLHWNNVQLASLCREQTPALSSFHPSLFLLIKFFKVLWWLLVWRTWSSCWGWELGVFFFTKRVVQGSGMHFIMMIQLLSDHEQVNATASSLLQLTHPVFSFWLGSLNYISIALTILHQRTLKRVQRCSTWIMSSTLQYGGRCLKTKWLLKLLGTQLSIQSSPTLTQLHKDWLSGSTAIAPGYKEQLY